MHLRVGSDADVGRFVQDLLGDRRAEQKRRLDEALARADANPNGNWSGSGSGSRIQMSTISGTGTQELSGLASGIHRQTLKNRLLGAAGLVALALSGGALAVMVLDRGDEAPETLRVIEAPEVSASASAPPKVQEKKPAPGESGDAIGLDALPEEEEDPSGTKKSAKSEKTASETPAATPIAPKATGQEWRPPPPAPVAVPPSKPAAKPSGNWKMDAGF